MSARSRRDGWQKSIGCIFAAFGPSKGATSGASLKEVDGPNQLTRAGGGDRVNGCKGFARFSNKTDKLRGFRDLGGSCPGSSRYDGRRSGSCARNASRRCVAAVLAESGEQKHGLKRSCGSSCQSAGAGAAVPDGDRERQRTEGLGFRLLQLPKAARGVSIRGDASQSPNRRWWSGVQRGTRRPESLRERYPQRVWNAPMVEPSEAGGG